MFFNLLNPNRLVGRIKKNLLAQMIENLNILNLLTIKGLNILKDKK